MTDQEKWNAIRENDRSCDGCFFYGVRSTGIFCRPSCPSKLPRRDNVIFFASAQEALQAGFRPCKRCRPQQAAHDPSGELAREARGIIDRTFQDRAALQEKLHTLGVTRRHLTQLFEKEYQTTPEEYAAAVRLTRAKALLAQGNSVTETAFAVGFESSASFASFFKKHTTLTPSAYMVQSLSEHPHLLVDTPVGPLRIEEDDAGITSVRFWEKELGTLTGQSNGRWLADADRQLQEYFQGSRQQFDLPLSLHGSPFQMKVWEALQRIPFGETRSYGQLAESIGNGKAARAVGMANNRNPIVIIVPCHRVIGKDGSPVGYAGGLQRKQFLLDMEERHAGR